MYFLSETNGAFMIISFLLAIVATVLAFVFIVPEKRRETLNAFGRFLHDTFNFKYLIVEKTLHICNSLYNPRRFLYAVPDNACL